MSPTSFPVRTPPALLASAAAAAVLVGLLVFGLLVVGPAGDPPPESQRGVAAPADPSGDRPAADKESRQQQDDDDEPTPDPTPAPLRSPERTAVVWTSGGLPEGAAVRLRDLPQVERASLVRGGLLELTSSADAEGELVESLDLDSGFVIPLDALAADPDGYQFFYDDAEAIAALGPSEAVLSETAAALRGVGGGGMLRLASGDRLTVTAVVPDELIGGAELLVDVATGAALGIGRERFLLTLHDGDLEALRDAVRRDVVDPEADLVRVEPTLGRPFVRHGSDVLTQAQVKQHFGEFSYRRDGPDRQVVQDPAWQRANIVRERVPILGRIRCHRALMPLVRDVLTEIEERGLADTVDPSGYAGCWNARLTNRLDALSRHSWGIAIDLNFPDNPVGSAGSMDPALVEAFAERGFVWGGDWLLTDPTHFELVKPPRS